MHDMNTSIRLNRWAMVVLSTLAVLTPLAGILSLARPL
jgi:hypothetical protein